MIGVRDSLTTWLSRGLARLERPAWGDLIAGLSVAMIAIPQALAYAELAGMPAYTGLYALALPAIAAALFASSPYLQTGPVAMTALLTLGVLSDRAAVGSPEYVGYAALLALLVGVIRVAIGLLRLGAIAYLMSQPILMGFTSAAALLIMASQLPAVLDVSPPVSGVTAQLWWTLMHPGSWRLEALALSLLGMAVIIAGRRLHPLFPGVLVAVVLGVVYSSIAGYGGSLVGPIPSGLPAPSLALPWAALPGLVVAALVIALVGFAEAASIARSYATVDRMRWDANREFVGQGVANLVAGLFSAFPVGGSFSRSSVNRLAGAKTRWSGAITGLVVLALLPLSFLLSLLPKAILGAIVIAAVYRLVQVGPLLALRYYSKPQFALALITFALTLLLAPRIDWAVMIGIVLAFGVHLWREQQLLLESWVDQDGLHFKLMGVLWFGSAYHLEEKLNALLARYPDAKVLKLHLGGLGRIDFSAALALRRFMEDARRAGLDIEVCEVPPMGKKWVSKLWCEVAREAP